MNTNKVTIKNIEINYSEENEKKEPITLDSLNVYDLKMFDYMLF